MSGIVAQNYIHWVKSIGNISGEGLGLVIIKKCVEVHGSKIYVQSEIGLGTVFTAILALQSFLGE